MTNRIAMLQEMIPWQRRLETAAFQVMLLNPGILIQVSPVMWGGGELPYDWGINMHISERGHNCAVFCYNRYSEKNVEHLQAWFNMKFEEAMGKHYELPAPKSKLIYG